MPKIFNLILICTLLIVSCATGHSPSELIGNFNVDRDLLLIHFDNKTDVDDLHSVAGIATMLVDSRFSNVKYHAVAGTYGIQEGLYVPANELFEAAFEDNWSDAHTNYNHALENVTLIAISTLKKGGNIWITEAGQSDFSAALIRNIKTDLVDINLKKRVNLVQHSAWNEDNTSPGSLTYLKDNISYHKIPDGNVIGNGSPGFKTDNIVNWKDYITDQQLVRVWEMAIEIANYYNGKDNRYRNPSIANGGMDFSDVSEACWIFGFEKLQDANQFFSEFSDSSSQ